MGQHPVVIGVTLEDHVGEFLSCDLHPERTRGLEYAQPIGLLHIRNHSVQVEQEGLWREAGFQGLQEPFQRLLLVRDGDAQGVGDLGAMGESSHTNA